MTKGRHVTRKSKDDPTYSAQWSGVTHAPIARGLHCSICGKHVHKESDSYYCPYCDDYVRTMENK